MVWGLVCVSKLGVSGFNLWITLVNPKFCKCGKYQGLMCPTGGYGECFTKNMPLASLKCSVAMHSSSLTPIHFLQGTPRTLQCGADLSFLLEGKTSNTWKWNHVFLNRITFSWICFPLCSALKLFIWKRTCTRVRTFAAHQVSWGAFGNRRFQALFCGLCLPPKLFWLAVI